MRNFEYFGRRRAPQTSEALGALRRGGAAQTARGTHVPPCAKGADARPRAAATADAS